MKTNFFGIQIETKLVIIALIILSLSLLGAVVIYFRVRHRRSRRMKSTLEMKNLILGLKLDKSRQSELTSDSDQLKRPCRSRKVILAQKEQWLINLINKLHVESDGQLTVAESLTVSSILLFILMYLVVNFYFIPKEAIQIEKLSNADNSPGFLTTFYILSRFINGTIVTAFFIFFFRLIASSFDQAIRYRKRMFSAEFLLYIYENHDVQYKISIKDVIDTYETWIKTIDSAFGGKEHKPGSVTSKIKMNHKASNDGLGFEIESENE